MGIKANFDWNGIDNYLEDRRKLLENLILRNLNYLGMKCVAYAKSLDTYKDQTGNLRNSIGYVIVKNGLIVEALFQSDSRGPAYGTSDKSGEVEGEKFAKEVARNFREGYVLIVVAGMEYASYVEDVRHLDVLQPAETLAKSEVQKIIGNIINSMKKT
ncbi:hypothetical protein BAS10_04465 [Elizabethkingia meningoseptica]|uniref:hypothetical protein n=1 Tax=Elizabethkingia meningoseptica TaxID=238 RepID=UPI00099A9AF1|nr:hypothetical protein [Elizabethkingia meningoseptica]OPB98927.1 hypothetical protein BAS10_04465 [Elizabethkingia meningoseptica]